MQTNQLLGMVVSSYMETPQDPVKLDVKMSVLPDGTMYAKDIRLDASAKDVSVSIENGGYRHISR